VTIPRVRSGASATAARTRLMKRPSPRLVDRLDAVALDLDGTLIHSAPDLARAANRMLRDLDAPPLDEARIEDLVGGGIELLVRRALALALDGPASEAVVERGLESFRATYRAHLFEHSRVYPSVVPALEALRAEGLELCCITNKAAAFAEPLLAAAGLDRYVPRVFSPQHARERKPQPVLVERACGVLGVAPAHLLCVGDSAADVGAARAAGCPVVAVDYGYHHGGLTGEHAPDWLISGLTEIVALPATPPTPRPILERVRQC
jgi:phosphoglycolate phosphatase